ncbi:ArsR/SmtB family transcription factor [Flexibacterium corallicola]|uniref:ArsR/SmtB family transcription factor n=1 Tax=Flexibacterium corallicola TaxID=3037259 RepID=UPI00286F45B6|nr:winged helix-turn-helix domain-containing protein [Pseudovibrio sp. M1P-2-3]
MLKAINNPVRMEILHWLRDPKANFDVADQLVDADVEGVCVSIIQEKTQLSQSTISSYLAVLQRAQLVTSKRIGPWTYYKRDGKNIDLFLDSLKKHL